VKSRLVGEEKGGSSFGEATVSRQNKGSREQKKKRDKTKKCGNGLEIREKGVQVTQSMWQKV